MQLEKLAQGIVNHMDKLSHGVVILQGGNASGKTVTLRKIAAIEGIDKKKIYGRNTHNDYIADKKTFFEEDWERNKDRADYHPLIAYDKLSVYAVSEMYEVIDADDYLTIGEIAALVDYIEASEDKCILLDCIDYYFYTDGSPRLSYGRQKQLLIILLRLAKKLEKKIIMATLNHYDLTNYPLEKDDLEDFGVEHISLMIALGYRAASSGVYAVRKIDGDNIWTKVNLDHKTRKKKPDIKPLRPIYVYIVGRTVNSKKQLKEICNGSSYVITDELTTKVNIILWGSTLMFNEDFMNHILDTVQNQIPMNEYMNMAELPFLNAVINNKKAIAEKNKGE